MASRQFKGLWNWKNKNLCDRLGEIYSLDYIDQVSLGLPHTNEMCSVYVGGQSRPSGINKTKIN